MMRCHTFAFRVGLAALAFALIPSPRHLAHGEIVASVRASTQKNFLEKEFAFDMRSRAEAYKAHGLKDPARDAQVLQFLEQTNRLACGQQDARPIADLERQGRLLYLSGCDDAMVQYDYGWLLQQMGRTVPAEEFLRRAAETLVQQGYAPTWQAAAARRASSLAAARGQRDEANKYADLVVKSVKEMVGGHEYGREDRALLVADLDADISALPAALRKVAWESIKDLPGADPLAVLQVEGKYHIAAAWEARGGGFAGTVTQEGWEEFAKHLAHARQALSKAWEIDKSIPEPPTAMITVAMGSGGADDMRLWFDRAILARFDFREAYTSYMYGLYPRWHGDRRALLDFGLECANTRRFDTCVPMQFIEVLAVVRDECDGGDMSKWGRAEVYDRVQEVFEKSLAPQGYSPNDWHNRSLQAAFCVQAQKWDDARRAVQQVNGQLDPTATSAMRLTPWEVRGAALALGSVDAVDALKARDLAAAGQRKEAIAAYETALRSQKDPDAARFLAGSVQVLRWEQDFRDGKEVALKADSHLGGFRAAMGKWDADPEGGFTGTARADSHLNLICEGDFGDAWELKATIGFDRKVADWDMTGVTVAAPGDTSYLGLLIGPKGGVFLARISNMGDGQNVPATVHDQDNEMIVRREGGRIVVNVNGKETYRADAPDDTEARRLRVGFGGWPLYNGDTAHFHNVRIRKIKVEP